ncbi:hypothetical protein [Streptomyces sp. NPDC001604]|uniref:hypothetical protein n=1 Tax=Streptomyces sp. NPDC001604 TaxID=3364593 RepID=UPI00367B9B19
MTTRTGNGRPRLVASAAGRGPAVDVRCRLRLKVDRYGCIQPRSIDSRSGLMNIYGTGAVVEVDLGRGSCLTYYDADLIAENLAKCAAIHIVSTEAYGERPRIERGTAYNADGAVVVLRWAIERAARRRGATAC